MTRPRLTAALLALACALALGPATALAEEKATTGPEAVEPVPGKAAPAPATPEIPPASQTTEPAPATPPGTTTSATPPPASVAPPVLTPEQQQALEKAKQQARRQQGDQDEADALTIAAIVLAAIVLVVLVVWLLWRWRGWDPRWMQRWRHATAEAGWRLSLGWAEFRDFVHLGR